MSRCWASGTVAAAALSVLLAACGGSDFPEAQPPPVALPPTVTTPLPVDSSASASPTPSPTPEPTSNSLPDGRHPAFLTGIVLDQRRVTIDVVQFFTGTAAATAAQEDGATEIPPPNDYWVRNRNTLLRTLTLTSDARITVNTLAAEESGHSRKDAVILLEKLASYPSLQGRLFWVTVAGNAITVLAEQYVP